MCTHLLFVANVVNAERQWRLPSRAYLHSNHRVANVVNAERQWRQSVVHSGCFIVDVHVANVVNAERQWRLGVFSFHMGHRFTSGESRTW